MELGNLSKKLIQILNRYKYVLLVFSLGLALMLFPGKVESVETVKNEDVHQITSVREVCEQ